MTGFGRGEEEGEGIHVFCELKSLNHRFFELRYRSPSRFSSFETQVRQQLRERFKRGAFEVSIRYQMGMKNSTEFPQVNRDLLSFYNSKAKEIARELGLMESSLSIRDLLNLPGAISPKEEFLNPDEDYKYLEGALTKAISSLEDMRKREGSQLKKILKTHLKSMQSFMQTVRSEQDQVQKVLVEKIKERITKLFADQFDLEDGRLLQEVAFQADRSDISEEVNRLEAHFQEFAQILDSSNSEPIGRKLDFIVQEMNREVNTIGSKSQGLEVMKQVVALKSEIEKIREQIQNIE